MLHVRHTQRWLRPILPSVTYNITCERLSRCSSQMACDVEKAESLSQPLLVNEGTKLSFINLRSHIPFTFSQTLSPDSDFVTTDSGEVVVYTDGSCLSNNTTDAGARKSGIGVYWGNDDHPLNVSMPHGGRKLTNNRAEIAAVHAAVILAKSFKIERLRLYTDSKNVVQACKYWLPFWENNAWRLKSSDKPVKNQDMWKKLFEDLRHVLVDFRHLSDMDTGIKKAHKLAQAGANCTTPEKFS